MENNTYKKQKKKKKKEKIHMKEYRKKYFKQFVEKVLCSNIVIVVWNGALWDTKNPLKFFLLVRM